MNHNLHQELADPIQRLAIAMEPGTYIRPIATCRPGAAHRTARPLRGAQLR